MTNKLKSGKDGETSPKEIRRATKAPETDDLQTKMKIARQCMERYHNALKKLAE